MRACKADERASPRRAGRHRILLHAAEQQGLCKTVTRLDHFDQPFLTFIQQAGQCYLALDQNIEAVRRLALLKQHLLAAKVANMSLGANRFEGRLR